jgi:hypothetical protein
MRRKKGEGRKRRMLRRKDSVQFNHSTLGPLVTLSLPPLKNISFKI